MRRKLDLPGLLGRMRPIVAVCPKTVKHSDAIAFPWLAREVITWLYRQRNPAPTDTRTLLAGER
jgi:hypothetical protein